MANIKISELPAAASALATQEFEVNELGTSKKVSGQQILDLVDANLGTLAQQNASSVNVTGGSIVGITDLAIADGGTGSSTAQGARNNLLPSQTGNANKFLRTNGSNVFWDNTGVNDGDKGDITVTGDGTIWTIDANAVTTSKINNDAVTTSKLSTTGVTAGTYGSPSDIPVVTIDNKGRVTSASTAPLTISGTLIGYQVFTSSGTYYKGVNNPGFVIVEVVGGGGGSTGSGGTSSFGSHCSATGGTTSTSGTGASGDINTSPIEGSRNTSYFAGSTGSTLTLNATGSPGPFLGFGKGATSSTTVNPTTSGTATGAGGGGYSKKKIAASSLAGSETVTVGSVGTGGSGGSNGVVIVLEYR